MKKISILLIITLCINYANAQTGNRDSIKLLLLNDKEDTSRVLHLAALSFEYLSSKPDTTITLALEALTLSRRIGFVKGEAVSLNIVGNAFGVLGNYPNEIQSYLAALKINEKINNLDGIQRNLGNMGIFYRGQGDYRKALQYIFKAKELAEKLNNKRSLSIHLLNIGEEYIGLKIFDSAEIFIQQGYNMASQINYPRVIGACLSDMGNIHFEKGENMLALEFYRLSVPYLEKSGNNYKLCITFLGIAAVFEKSAIKDSALFYANKELKIAKEKRFTRLELDAAKFLSGFYKNKGNTDSAFFYLQAANTANDSIFNQRKLQQIQSIDFDEKLRQQEIASAELKAKEERKNNLQYAAIAIALITFIMLFFLLSRSIIVKTKFIEFFGVLGLLAVFEFINLFIHPYLAHATNDSPVLMLVVLIAIGALLIPLHHKLEKWITKIMVEKNKKIRLEAAKKTIAKLGGEPDNK